MWLALSSTARHFAFAAALGCLVFSVSIDHVLTRLGRAMVTQKLKLLLAEEEREGHGVRVEQLKFSSISLRVWSYVLSQSSSPLTVVVSGIRLRLRVAPSVASSGEQQQSITDDDASSSSSPSSSSSSPSSSPTDVDALLATLDGVLRRPSVHRKLVLVKPYLARIISFASLTIEDLSLAVVIDDSCPPHSSSPSSFASTSREEAGRAQAIACRVEVGSLRVSASATTPRESAWS